MDDPVDYPLALRHNLLIIEDCAHAVETEYKGRKVGTFGDFGCMSFYVTKNIVTGEGGMLAKEEQAAKIKVLALHGMSKDAWNRFGDDGYKHYYVQQAGFKFNMMDLQAAIGLQQLKRIEPYWKSRQAIWKHYNSKVSSLPLGLRAEHEPDTTHAYHLYSVLVDQARAGIIRDEFLNAK